MINHISKYLLQLANILKMRDDLNRHYSESTSPPELFRKMHLLRLPLIAKRCPGNEVAF